MKNKHGDFVWYELCTPDPESAKAFYTDVIGWNCSLSEASQPEMPYHEWSMGDAPIGGMMQLTEEMKQGGARPGWLSYVEVDDVDKQAEKLTAAGAVVCVGPQDIPGVGRFAMFIDPQGAPLYVMKDTSGHVSEAFSKHEPKLGHCAWNELAAGDGDAAFDFYASQFGWQRGDTMDGPMGHYQFIQHDGVAIGGISGAIPEGGSPAWSFFFRVANIDDAVGKVKSGGGQIMAEPMEIPGGDRVIYGVDPQGAVFALVGA